MTTAILIAIVGPAAAALVTLIVGWRTWSATLTVVAALGVLGCGIALAVGGHGTGWRHLALGGCCVPTPCRPRC